MAQFTIVIVTGMHRSGTSLTAETLHKAGLPMGTQFLPGDSYNPRGYFEDVEIVRLHDRLLDAFSRPWGAADHMRPLPEGWLDSPAAAEAQEGLYTYLSGQMATHAKTGFWAVKDPRTSLFLPLWARVARQLGAGLKLILCLRNAAAVAASLNRRDGMPDQVARLLWLGYNAAVIEHAPKASTLVFYGDWRQAPSETAARLTRFIGLEGATLPDTLYEAAYTTVPPAPSEGLCGQWDATFDAARKNHRITAAMRTMSASFTAHARVMDAVPGVLLSDGAEAAEANRGLSRDLANYRTAYATLNQTKEKLEAERAALLQAEAALRDDLAAEAARTQEAQAAQTAAQAEAQALQQAALREQAASLEADRNAQAEAAIHYQTAYQEADKAQAAIRADVTRLEAERDDLVKVADSHLQAYRVLEERIAARDAALTAQTETQAMAQARAGELEQRLAETQAQAQAQLAQAEERLEQRLAEVQARATEAEDTRAGLETTLSAERQARAGLEDTLAIERRARSQAEAQVAAQAAAQAEEVRSLRVTLEGDLSAERAARAEAEAAQAGMQERLGGAETVRTMLENSLGELQKGLATLQAALDSERATAQNLQAALTTEQGTSSRLQGELDETRQAFARMEQRAADNIAAYQEIDRRLAQALDDLARTGAERDSQTHSATEYLALYTEANAALAATRTDLETLTQAHATRGDEAARTATALSRAEARLAETRAEVARLRKWHVPSILAFGRRKASSETKT